MKYLKLRGKHAVGDSTLTTVDDDMHGYLSQWRWKAKPNGKANNIYAVRNIQVGGKYSMVRMHRVVLGYYGPLDIDHINHDALDNRRENLRIATRSENILNSRYKRCSYVCSVCHTKFFVTAKAQVVFRYCTDMCKSIAARTRRPLKTKKQFNCQHCTAAFMSHHTYSKFCTERCKKASKRVRQRRLGTPPPSTLHGHHKQP